ncbi:MAG: hypothetical protein EBU00_10255, partial [Alphaproteobacteria bacterium]|nr:hypothetical protein [Alphaproteobacteria bacterium]
MEFLMVEQEFLALLREVLSFMVVAVPVAIHQLWEPLLVVVEAPQQIIMLVLLTQGVAVRTEAHLLEVVAQVLS